MFTLKNTEILISISLVLQQLSTLEGGWNYHRISVTILLK